MAVNNEMNIYYPKMVANFQQKTKYFDSRATNLKNNNEHKRKNHIEL